MLRSAEPNPASAFLFTPPWIGTRRATSIEGFGPSVRGDGGWTWETRDGVDRRKPTSPPEARVTGARAALCARAALPGRPRARRGAVETGSYISLCRHLQDGGPALGPAGNPRAAAGQHPRDSVRGAPPFLPRRTRTRPRDNFHGTPSAGHRSRGTWMQGTACARTDQLFAMHCAQNLGNSSYQNGPQKTFCRR